MAKMKKVQEAAEQKSAEKPVAVASQNLDPELTALFNTSVCETESTSSRLTAAIDRQKPSH